MSRDRWLELQGGGIPRELLYMYQELGILDELYLRQLANQTESPTAAEALLASAVCLRTQSVVLVELSEVKWAATQP